MTTTVAPAAAHPLTFGEIPRGRIALWWVIASEIVIFGGLISCYVLYRLRHPEWAAYAAHTSTPFGALNTVVLLTSSLTAVLAHAASERGDLARVRRYLGATLVGGAMFLVVKSIEYTHEIEHGFTLSSNLFWSFYYFMTGLHAGHVIAGMIAIAVVRHQAGRGQQMQRVEYVGLYWHFVDIVWIFLFPLLYLAK
jgi:heme/copper-type cytochrome/quinol oxidase subunit 3